MAFFGEASRISRTIGGVLYGLAVRFWLPSTQAGSLGAAPVPETITSGVIEGVESLGGGSYRLRMRRGPQTFFYVIPPLAPGGGSIEVPYTCEMGGNVAMPAEWQRGYSHLNGDFARRGSMMANRVVPGDGAVLVRDRPTLPAMVTRADAHAWEPEAVNYAGSAPLPGQRFTTLELYDIRATRQGPGIAWINQTGRDVAEGEIVVTSEWSGTALADIAQGTQGQVAVDLDGEIVFDGLNTGRLPSGLVLWDDDTPALATRVIFAPAGGDPEPNFLPANLGASGWSGPVYWWDPVGYSARLASDCFLTGTEADLVWWIRSGQNVPADLAANAVVVEAGVGLGPGVEFDNQVSSSWATGGDGDWQFNVTGGAGLFEWRQTTAVDSRKVTLMLGSGGIDGAFARLAPGDDAEELTLASLPTYAQPYQVRLVKAGGTFTVYSRQDSGDAWTELGDVELEDVVESTDGFIGLGSWGEGWIRFAGEGVDSPTRFLLRTGSDGTHAVLRTTGRQAFSIAENTGLSATGVAEVYNVTTGEVITAGSGVRRDEYRVLEGTIWAVAENSGDRWRVTYAASGTPPEPPGRAPRPVTGQPERGWVEVLPDPNPDYLPSENTAANLANWGDVVELRFEDGSIPLVGETIEFARWGVFDPAEPPTVNWSIRNDEAETWATLPGEAFLAFWYAGLLLIRQSWLDANLDVGELLCLKAEGKVLKSDLLADADRWRELRRGVEVLDGLWVEVPNEGFIVAIRGGELARDLGVVEYDELDRPIELGVGLLRSRYVLGSYEVPTFPPGAGLRPYWAGFPGIASIGFADSVLRNGYVWDGTTPGIIEGDAELLVYPFPGGWYSPGPGAPLALMGTFCPRDPAFPDSLIGTRFAVRGLPFSPGGVFAKLPDNAVIVGAWLELTVENLKEQVWSYELVTGPASYKSIVQDINGERVVTYLRNEAGTVITNEIDGSVPLLVDGAAVSFDLIGRRIDRRNVVDWFGNVLELPADEYLTVGGGIGGTQVTPGVKTLVDVTAAMQAIVRLRASKSAFDGYELWPSFGVSPEADPDGLGGYLRGLAPVVTHSQSGDVEDPQVTLAMSGRYAQWDGMEAGRLLVAFELEESDPTARPINPPPAV